MNGESVEVIREVIERVAEEVQHDEYILATKKRRLRRCAGSSRVSRRPEELLG